MRAAHDDAYTSRPEPAGEAVSVISTRRVKGDADDIRLIRPVDVFGLFIDMRHLPTGRNLGCQIRHGDLLEIQEPRSSHFADFIGGSSNQEKFRQLAPSAGLAHSGLGRTFPQAAHGCQFTRFRGRPGSGANEGVHFALLSQV